jgi:hypothetical protein
MAMSDADDLESLQKQLAAETRAAEALRAQYIKALQELRDALQRQAELQELSAKLDKHAHSFE